ncbi:MAG: iron uptake porin, partial [Thermosynechococcaceae cyanobacterium]
YKLLYVFPVSKQVTGFVFPKAETTDAFPQIIPWSSESQGAISRFAGVNPVVRQSGGTSGVGLASGLGFIWKPSDKVNLTALYGSVSAPIVTGDLSTGNALGSGFLPSDQSSYIAAAQLTFSPTKNLDTALNVAYAQHNVNILGTGLASSGIDGFRGGDIFALPGLDLGQRVQVIGLGGTVTYRITPKIALSAYGAGFFVDNVSGGRALATGDPVNANGSAAYTSFMGGIHFSDVFAEGNTAALIAGQPLYAESTGGSAAISPDIPGVFNSARPFHIEGYYRFKVNDNISITPGVFAVFNPESNSENSTAVVGVVRASFTF